MTATSVWGKLWEASGLAYPDALTPAVRARGHARRPRALLPLLDRRGDRVRPARDCEVAVEQRFPARLAHRERMELRAADVGETIGSAPGLQWRSPHSLSAWSTRCSSLPASVTRYSCRGGRSELPALEGWERLADMALDWAVDHVRAPSAT
jgi:hypothetical protein